MAINGWIGGNRSLNQGAMQNNAQIVWTWCKLWGWADAPIYAMLGNMVQESTINPQRYEGGREPVKGQSEVWWGYGLTQWTKAQKLFDWCYANNLDYSNGDVQMRRIKMEWESTFDRYDLPFVQWIGPTATDAEGRTYCTYTFKDFSEDTEHSIAWLTEAFMKYYERPKAEYANLSNRVRWSNYWASFLRGGQGTYVPRPGEVVDWVIKSSVPSVTRMNMIPLYMYQNRKNYRKKGEN